MSNTNNTKLNTDDYSIVIEIPNNNNNNNENANENGCANENRNTNDNNNTNNNKNDNVIIESVSDDNNTSEVIKPVSTIKILIPSTSGISNNNVIKSISTNSNNNFSTNSNNNFNNNNNNNNNNSIKTNDNNDNKNDDINNDSNKNDNNIDNNSNRNNSTEVLKENSSMNTNGIIDKEVPEENYSLPYHHQQNNLNNGEAVIVKLDVPVPLREEPKFPKEKWKTFVAFVVLSVNFILATVSLSLVHEKLPDRTIYKPLPDIILDTISPQDWALNISEIIIMITVNSCILLIIFHKHRFIVMRRIFLILSLLYFMRSITMYVTVLPVSSTTYYCSPKLNTTATPLVIAKRVFQLISGFGLSINGKHTYCGDMIYSGHTVMLVLGYLVISEYSPRRFYILHWTSWIASFVGVICVLLAHGHYTIDVLIAYYVTTRLFWTYHTIANNSFLQSGSNNYIGREWWCTWFFKYFERNIRGPLPRQYEWPLPWPRHFHSKLPNRES